MQNKQLNWSSYQDVAHIVKTFPTAVIGNPRVATTLINRFPALKGYKKASPGGNTQKTTSKTNPFYQDHRGCAVICNIRFRPSIIAEHCKIVLEYIVCISIHSSIVVQQQLPYLAILNYVHNGLKSFLNARDFLNVSIARNAKCFEVRIKRRS